MQKLNRGRSSERLGERVEFRFSNFRAVQVPVVSDRLLLSIISVGTGKTIAKSSKAAARNGICQWPDSILQTIWFSQDEVSKEFEECQYKIIVSMGSTKTAILGEVFLNLTNYLSSADSTAISLSLKRCNSGTVLQLNIQCLGTKSKSSGMKSWNELSRRLDERSLTNDVMDNKSDCSDSMLNRSAHSFSGNHLGSAYQDEAGNRDASVSTSMSHRSSNSGDSTTDRINLSPRDNSNEELYMGRQDSASSYASHVSAGRGDETYRSNNSFFSSRTPGRNIPQGNTAQPFASGLARLSSGAPDSSKDLLDTAEETIEELRDEAKMWERHSRKMKIDLESLKKECADKSRQQAELALELSASHAERDSLTQEVEELKSSLKEVTARQTITQTPKSGDVINLQKEIKDEVQFLKESNANLTTQLKKTQEANIELVSILQELEETIEVQRAEISNLSHTSDAMDHEVSKNELSVQEVAEWATKLSLKEDEITMLREKLDRILNIENTDGAGSDAIYLELEKENDFLKVKIQELEKDCSELTEENLELIYKLKEVSGVVKGEDPCVSNSEEMSNVGDLLGRSTSNVKYLERKCADLELKLLNFRSESSELEEKFQKSQEELNERTLELSEMREKLRGFHATELEGAETGNARCYQLRSEELDTETDLDVFKHRVLLKEQEIEGLQHSKKEMENFISEIQKEKSQLEERLAASLKESSIPSKCLDEVRQDLLVLTSSIDSHVSANNVLETNISELESCKVELELHISKLEHENIQLSESISGLEAQLTYLSSEKESSMLRMDDSRSLITNLKDKVEQQQAEMEARKLELKQKQLESKRRLSEVQEDSEALRRSNAKLQATIDSVVEECNSLQTLTADLKKQKLELHGRATQLEQELEHSKRKTMDFCKTVEFLEAKLSSLQKDITSREQSLLSELDNIFQEHKKHEERIDRAHFLLNKIEKEKTVEVENLEREVMSLTIQVSSTHEERESATLDTIREASILRADKAKLESNLEDVNAQMRHYESQVEDLRKESKSKIKALVDSLNTSKQNEEMLTTDVDHMRRLMEAARSSEENLRKTSGELELKFKSSDYEKQQIMEEISELKIQVHKIAVLQDEVSKLQSCLDEAKFEKGKLEELLQSLSEECEELKAQKAMITDKVLCMQGTLNNADEEKRSKTSMQAKLVIKQGNDDVTNDNGGSPVNEDPDIQSKIQLLETRFAETLEENKLCRTQIQSPMPERQSGSRDGKENNDDKIVQLESELKDMKDRLLNMSMQYAEVEAQREQLVMELKTATAKKGRWF